MRSVAGEHLELDRRVVGEQPTVFGLRLGEEPEKDSRPWVRGCENELVTFGRAVTQASCRKQAADPSSLERSGRNRLTRCDAVNADARPGYKRRRWPGGMLRHNRLRIWGFCYF